MRGLNSRKLHLISDPGFNYDICFVQETQLSREKSIKDFGSRWRGPSFWAPAAGKQGGVAILIKESLEGKIVSWSKDSGGRILSLLLELPNMRINLINIYAPVNLTASKAFFENLHTFLFPADNIVIGGDFNCYDHNLDKFGGNISIATCLSELRSGLKLVDVWRRVHRNESEMSWWNADLTIGSRLDKFYTSKGLTNLVQRCDISPCVLSDHDYVNLVFDFQRCIPRGPGIWKFNSSLLADELFCDFVSERSSDLSACRFSFDSIKDWWDFFKESLKSDIISYARGKRKRLCRERVSLTNRLIKLKRQLIQGSSLVVSEILLIEAQLAAMVDRSWSGIKIRSRAQWLEEGEKPSRFFFKLERERIEQCSVTAILDKTGKEVSTSAEIEQAHIDFYTSLFSAEDIDSDCQSSLFDEIKDKVLSDPDRAVCEGQLSLAELTLALKSMNLNKAPGPDGFTAEFYLRFWEQLGPLLLEVINQSFRDGELPESMKTSATRLIYKKRGNIKDLKNWRPISLLNVDYKICSKSITLRLAKVLSTIVDPDQTCSVPGRTIASNVTLLRDTLDYIEQTNETGILVSLDQEKAFDRVNRGFLMGLLERLGFGPDFRRWISTFYYEANMKIILNGWLTKPISLHRGVRQGDSLSPLLYVLCVEMLACKIRNCDRIRGFLLPGASGRQFKVRQYADDTTAFLKDYSSLVCLFSLIALYEKGSGAKLNRSKTEAMWLGAWRSRTDEPLGLTWVRKMKILGVVFGTIPVDQDNWQPKISKLEKVLNLWKARPLSLIGKSMIINTLGLSKIFYLAKVIIIPRWVLSRINQLVWPFLWGSKIETVSRHTCYLPVSTGGLGVVNLDVKCKALRLSSVVDTVNRSEDSSFFLSKYFIGAYLAPLRADWAQLRNNATPSALTLTQFYSTCVGDLRKVDSLARSSDALSTKNIYLQLLKVGSSPPVLPYRWAVFLGADFSLEEHWARVRDSACENFKNDLLWLITLRGVKVRDSLRSWGYIDSDRCAVCSAKETIDHCFLNCPRAKRVWARFTPTLSFLTDGPFRVNLLTAFFWRWSSNHRKKGTVARYLIKTILYAIWSFRNKATFRNATDDHYAIIKYVTHDVTSRINLDYGRLSFGRFSRLWGVDNFIRVDPLNVTVLFK